MKFRAVIGALLLSLSLGACVGYHQEDAALRMPRPRVEPPELTSYAAANNDYPSVGGDILKGTSPREAAAYDSTVGAPADQPADRPAPQP